MSQELHQVPPAEQQPPREHEPVAPAGSQGVGNGFALTAIILGVIAVVTSFVPFLGAVVAVPTGLAAVVLGIVGRTRASKFGGGGLALAGAITGAVGIAIAVLWAVLAAVIFESDPVQDAFEGTDVPGVEVPVEPEAGTVWTESLTGEFWFAGMQVELQDAELLIDDGGDAALHVQAMFANHTDGTVESFAFDDMWLESNGDLAAATFDSTLEAVPAGGRNRGTLVFPAADDFELAGAVLYAGSPSVQQAVVPLDGADGLVDGAPIELDVSGEASASGLTLEVTQAVLRTYDAQYRQLDAGSLALLLTVDLVNDSGGSAHPINYEFRLELPDGRTASPDTEPWGVLFDGERMREESLSFSIDDPAGGDYVLILEFDEEQGTLEFDL